MYLSGMAVFGFLYYLVDGMLDSIIASGVGESGSILDLLIYFWAGAIIIYLIFGGWWMIRKYNENQYRGEL